ncbi:MAG TPA: amino acid ABC transporter substrate-binding protein [Stellaceae bacterium]|nr:amino acid ABC transporter substrate-binding protein [Stellaceae bacterium]
MSMVGRRLVLAVAAAAAFGAALPAQAAEPIKIGLSMSLTGGLAGGGKSALLGMQMWAEDINARGGLLGRPAELVYYDDQSSSSNVPGIYTKLLEVDKVDLAISAYATNQIAPAMPIVMQKNMVFMALFGTGVNDKFHYDKYFQILPNGKETRFGPSLGFLETALTMEPKPKTIALAGADAEYAQTVLAGAREKIKEMGLKIVYDRSYPPSTVDFIPIVRSIQAAEPDVVYVASYPPDTVGMVRAAHETGLKARMFGGGMIGLAFAPIKQQLGPLLNGIVAYDVYVPEPTMKFPGVEDFLKKYQAKAPTAGVDPLGFYLPPFAYAELQILGEAISKVGSLDQDKIGKYIHATTFHTIVGDVKFADNGEWEKPRLIFVQYRGVSGSDVNQFKEPGKAVIVYPPELRSGKFEYPYTEAQK